MKKFCQKLYNLYGCLKFAVIDTIMHDGVEHAGYLSFLAILSFFPFLVFFVSLLAVFGETELGAKFVQILFANLPEHAVLALKPRIDEILSGPPQGLLTIAVLGAIWTASSTVEGLRTIFNRAYRVTTPPNYILRRLLSILQFLIITFLIIMALLMVVFVPIFIEYIMKFLHLDNLMLYKVKLLKLSFLLTFLVIFLSVSFIYYVIPNVKQGFRNICPGALLVVFSWLILGNLFSLYISSFDQVNIIYGSLASLIITLMFFFLIAMILIVGAEFNYAIEKMTGFQLVEKRPRKQISKI
jgi:membrane protein